MKKFVSVIICFAFILPALFGCSSNNAETSAVNTDGDTSGAVTGSGTPDGPGVLPAPSSDVAVRNMRVNYEKEPDCVEDRPSFSWTLESDRRGACQTSYRIRVAQSEADLADDGKPVWDSGVVQSSDTLNIVCDKELSEAERYYWRVTVGANNGTYSDSAVSHFNTALINTGFDGAEWIAEDRSAGPGSDFYGCSWIWLLNGDSQGDIAEKTEYFRYSFNIEKEIGEAYIAYTADDCGDLYINGEKAAVIDQSRGWQNAVYADASSFLENGVNIIACSAVNTQVGYGAVIVKLYIKYTDGTQDIIISDGNWKASDDYNENWYKPDFDAANYKTVNSVTEYGGHPWFENVSFPGLSKGAPTVRYEFEAKSGIRSAFLFASAAGLYDAYINGGRASRDVLDPGRSEYTERVMYQCHDVTDLLREGKNCVGAVLGRGWYIGAYSPYGGRFPAFICKLVIKYENGETQTVCTNGDWKFTVDGPIVYDDIFNGETYDAGRELTGWSDTSFDDSEWPNVITTSAKDLGLGELVPQLSGTVKVMDTLQAKEVTEPKNNVYVYDFGQNLAGTVTLRIKADAGTVVKLRHAEMLNDGNNGSDGPKGTIYTANLRSAAATDTYTAKGDPNGETYTPTFTFHGFRYLEITGLKTPPALSDVTANVIYSDMEDTGRITTSDELVNQLVSNTYWGQRGNFLSTPTDCPQRDERMGWSGDAQIFCGTAAYNMNVKSFFDKYVTDLNDCQRSDGSYPDVAPQTYRGQYTGSGNNAWGDAGVIIPWIMYLRYDDVSYIKKYYGNMKKYAKYLLRTSSEFIRSQSAYGDWLSIGESTRMDVTDTAYCVYVFDIMYKIATVLGNDSDAKQFLKNAENYREAWNRKFVKSKGLLRSDTQTSYLVALAFNIVPEEDRQLFADRLNEKILKNGTKLTTGFIGCPLLLPILCECGHSDTAFALLQQQEYPSWKYPILQGATTIWERWNSYTVSDGFGSAGMNSFNHYSYGSVTEWIYSYMLGIKCINANPGFKRFALRPTAGADITSAEGEYDSVRGLIKSAWEARDGVITSYKCTVPCNTTAVLYLQAPADSITESGSPLSTAEGITEIRSENGMTVIELSSGSYSFKIS